MAFCFLPIAVLLFFKAVSQTLSLYKRSSYGICSSAKMANAILCLVASDSAKISLSDVRKTGLPSLLSLEAFPEPSGLSTRDFPEARAVAVCGGFLQRVVLVVSATLDASGQVGVCPRPARGWSSGWPRVGASLHPAPSCPARWCLLRRHTQPAPCLPLISEELLT